MHIIFNNLTEQIPEHSTVQSLLDQFVSRQNGIAVAVNDTVVSHTRWQSHVLQSGDKVLVIKATQGG